MLDGRGDFRPLAVGAGNVPRHRLTQRLLAMDAGAAAVACQMYLVGLRAVGRVGPDVADCVVFREETNQLRPVVVGRVGGDSGPDHPVAAIDSEWVAYRISILNMNTRSNGGRSPLDPPERGQARARSFWNSSKSTMRLNIFSVLPLDKRSFRPSSTSNKAGPAAHRSSPIKFRTDASCLVGSDSRPGI